MWPLAKSLTTNLCEYSQLVFDQYVPKYLKKTNSNQTRMLCATKACHLTWQLIVFFGKGKVTWFKQLMKASPKVIHAFTQLSSICELQKEVHQGLEEFMWLLYGERGATITDVATIRWQIFSRFQAESQNMPPTRGTLVEHMLSAHVQLIVWTMAGVAKPSLPSHVQYACWTEYAVGLSLLVTKLDPAPVSMVELVRCSSKCSTNRCLCKKWTCYVQIYPNRWVNQ